MKKKITALTLTLATILTLATPLTAQATGTTPKTVPSTTSDQSPFDQMPYGVNMGALWIAEADKYDIAETGLEAHDFATITPGKTYEIAVHITNKSDKTIATPYGIDYEISVPRTILANHPGQIEVTAQSDARNTDDLWNHSWVPSAKITASEDVALIYKDQSNYVYHLEDGKLSKASSNGAGFSWRSGSRVLDKDNILLSATGQTLYAGTSEIVTFQVEAVPLAKWQELAEDMRKNPVEVEVDDVYQSLLDDDVHISATLNLPKWLRDRMKGSGDDQYWRIMAQPKISDDGRTVSVCVRVENYSAAYAVTFSRETTLRGGDVRLSNLVSTTFKEHKGSASFYEGYEGKWTECHMSDYDFRKDEVVKIDMTVSTR